MAIITPLPRALILALTNWFGAPRLLKSLRRAGFHVTTFAFPGLLIQKTQSAHETLLASDSASCDELVDSLLDAIERCRADVIIPTDDTAVLLLQAAAQVAAQSQRSPGVLSALAASLGDERHRPTVRSRKLMARLAEEAGARQPPYAAVHDEAEALSFAAEHGYPIVLKQEESVAGMGVSICKDEVELRSAVAQAARDAMLEEGMLAQTFIEGRTAMRVVVASQGRVLGGLSAVKLHTWPGSTGPSTCVELIDHAEMKRSAEAIVRALGYSGFASLDFMLDGNGEAHLIELNARPTPIAHLGDRFGSCLCRQLRAAILGESHVPTEPQGLPARVALFPQEWIRDQNSPHLASETFHDVPWDEPDLVEAYMLFGRGQMRWGSYRLADQRNDALRAKLSVLEAH